MRKKRVEITSTGTTFTTGEVFSPNWDDLHYVVGRLWEFGILEELVPEIKIPVILAHRGPMYRTVPLLLERADAKYLRRKPPFNIMAMLWVVACFNYKYCQGPYPGTIKRMKRKKHGPVLEFRCPMCGQDIFEPNKRYKNRRVIIEQYANALSRHSGECEELLHLDRRIG